MKLDNRWRGGRNNIFDVLSRRPAAEECHAQRFEPGLLELEGRIAKGGANPRGYAFGLAERLSRDLLREPATRCAESSPALVAENSASRVIFWSENRVPPHVARTLLK